MREVLLIADPHHPLRVTQRQYDNARQSSGLGHTPRADKLVERYGLPWRRLLLTVIRDEDAARTIARATHATVRLVLTRLEAVAALRAAARHLNTDQLTPVSYEEARKQLDASVRRRHLHGRSVTPLPSVDVIRAKFSFPDLATDAGLRVVPRDSQRLMPRSEAVILFIEHCGFLPRQLDLCWFASPPHPARRQRARASSSRDHCRSGAGQPARAVVPGEEPEPAASGLEAPGSARQRRAIACSPGLPGGQPTGVRRRGDPRGPPAGVRPHRARRPSHPGALPRALRRASPAKPLGYPETRTQAPHQLRGAGARGRCRAGQRDRGPVGSVTHAQR